YILTNHHVIRNVHDITVSVMMGQEPVLRKYLADVVEIQPEMDLAVIRITDRTGRNFIPAPLGNSNNLMVGQQVAAIGSPFGLTQSASAGIVSNCDRTLTAGDKVFTGLIQTDASINPGSSGGALINETGEVIGINTAIYSLSMGFSGIGFAVPINRAKRVFAPFIKTIESPMLADARAQGARARVPSAPNPEVGGVNVKMMAGPGQASPAVCKNCWLGVDILPVDSTVAREFNVPFNGGMLVNRVFKLSPSDVAGVKRGDVLFRIDGRRISDQDMLWSSLSAKESREPVTLTLFRQGKRVTLTAIMEPEPANVDLLLRQGHIPPGAPPMIGEISWVGIDFQPIEPRRAKQFGIAPDLTGVVIGEVEGIAAIEAGLLPGDVVLYLNSQPVTDIGVLKNIVKKINPGEGVVLDILRRDQRFYITVQPSPLDMGAWQ
ncbi:MAG: trypsin-like peptidase domain-containing protein, partial [Phycisphaeraceae bacterium]|nr:trypsin-like peptidase domain-containing protein [Phycisphaeraceae bacterium]